uniref:Uncharacterized protein n=1 Tax=Ditylenchus dipsaci TaxID=166011 RepID=A0A915EJF2_9BILA
MMTIIEDDYKMLEGMDQAAFMEALVSISCIRDVDKVEYCSKKLYCRSDCKPNYVSCQAIDKSVVKTDSASIRLSSLLKAFIESVVRGSINAQEIYVGRSPITLMPISSIRLTSDFAQYCYDIRSKYNEAENRMSNEPMTDKFVYPDLARNYIPGGQERFRCVLCNSDSMFLQLPQWLLPFLSYMVVAMTSEALSDADDNYSGLHKFLAKYMKRRRMLRRNVLFNKPANDRMLISNQNFTEPAFLNEMNKVTSGFWVNTRAFTAYALIFLGYKNFEQYGNRKTKLNEVLLINRSAAARLTIKKPLLGVDILYMLEKIKPDNFNSAQSNVMNEWTVDISVYFVKCGNNRGQATTFRLAENKSELCPVRFMMWLFRERDLFVDFHTDFSGCGPSKGELRVKESRKSEPLYVNNINSTAPKSRKSMKVSLDKIYKDLNFSPGIGLHGTRRGFAVEMIVRHVHATDAQLSMTRILDFLKTSPNWSRIAAAREYLDCLGMDFFVSLLEYYRKREIWKAEGSLKGQKPSMWDHINLVSQRRIPVQFDRSKSALLVSYAVGLKLEDACHPTLREGLLLNLSKKICHILKILSESLALEEVSLFNWVIGIRKELVAIDNESAEIKFNRLVNEIPDCVIHY